MIETIQVQLKDFNDFKLTCKHFGIEINNNQLDLFKRYYEILLEWNKKINLVSRKEENVLEKHFLDSIIFLPEIEGVIARRDTVPTKQSYKSNMQNEIASVVSLPRNDNFCIFDIGSGGGFPAIPLGIMKPEWNFTLCESIKKKANVLSDIINELELKNAIVINARVGARHGTPLQNKYDFVTARAVAKLDELIKYALPLLKKNGYLIAYKSKDIDDEIKKVTLPLQIFSKEVNSVTRKLVTIRHNDVTLEEYYIS